jgi:thioredoxin-related protein
MKKITLFVLALFLLGVSASYSQNKDSSGTKSAGRFDVTRDPESDLAKAINEARHSNKKILIDVGGEWCIWCRKLDKFFEENSDAAKYMHKHFVVMKVNYSKENKNEKFLSKYPKITGYPHIFILDKKGALLKSKDTGELESGDHHDKGKVLAFLKEWAKK